MKTRKLTEADVTSESVFMLQRRQILKMLGISATALTLTPAAHAGGEGLARICHENLKIRQFSPARGHGTDYP